MIMTNDSDPDRRLLTVQVFVNGDPQIAENVAVRAADYITESFEGDPNCWDATVQTVLVHSGPFTFTEEGIVHGAVVFDGEPELRILRELSHDPDMQVRGMARRLLEHEEGRS